VPIGGRRKSLGVIRVVRFTPPSLDLRVIRDIQYCFWTFLVRSIEKLARSIPEYTSLPASEFFFY